MVTQENQFSSDTHITKVNLNKRLEEIGWGLFLLMIGILLLLPGEMVPRGAWLIGAGLIMLGINAIRHLYRIGISRFTVVLGFVAMLIGLASFFGLRLPLLAMFLTVIGASIILKALLAPSK